ncbi:MAG TPA: hypothetical protein VN892_11265, partial [Solirubrobacteraceae bacterium]|nr:hypothetical protein [Solirubrobacteraceae bacterium]
AASRSINTWALVGPLVAAIMLLSTLTAGALDIADTLQTTGVLPVAQVVLNIACTDISDGKPPYPRQAPEARDRCLIGGYYVGENSTWVYLVKRENSCPGHQPVPARLVELRRSEISEMVILAKPECPRDSRCGEC